MHNYCRENILSNVYLVEADKSLTKLLKGVDSNEKKKIEKFIIPSGIVIIY